MRLLIFLLPILFFVSNQGFAQKNYEKGYIITNQNKLVKGYVKDRKPNPFGKLYKKIYFKSRHRKRKYGPNQIKGYKQGTRTFESMWVSVSSDLINEKYKSIPNNGEKEFLKVIEKGYLTYYQREFTDQDSDYIDHISLFKRVDQDTYIRVTQGIFGLRRYSLIKYFSDSPELVKKIKNGQLKTPLEIIIFYNNYKAKNLNLI